MKFGFSIRAICLAGVAIVLATATAVAAEHENDVGDDALIPEYRAVVIYTAAEDGPEQREIFGEFENFKECMVHAQARRSAMITRKLLHSGEAYCLYREDEKAEPRLLR